jgi:anaerobic selenocysteine-containing dehydrogenase
MAQLEKTTYCRICEVYCGMIATVEDGRVTRLRPDKDHVVSRGYACPKGVTFHQVTHDPDRILHPMKREGTSWRRISWEQAVSEIGAGLKRIRDTHGPHAIGLYTGNPAGYSYSHRVFSSSWIDAVGSRNSFGAGSQDNLGDFLASKFLYGASFLQPVPDLARTRWALIVGTNPVVSQGTLMHVVDAKRRIAEIRARGGRVVVLDPRRTETARIASEHHFIRPESDAFLFLAMIRTILEDGIAADDFLAKHTSDLPWLRDAVSPYTPEAVAGRVAVDAATIRRLAHEIARTDGACAFGRVVCGRFGTLAAWALEVLNLVAGNLDRPGGMVFSDALVDMVGIVDRMGRDEYGRHRSRIGDYPEVLGELPSGILADEITTPGAGQIRALVVTAGNPVLSIPNGRALAAAMERLELGVALDFYLSETAARCHYILPCTTYLEREDFPIFHAQLMTEPYAQWTEPVIPPQGEAKQEWEIFSLLSEAMGVPFLNNRAAAVLRRALRLAGRDFSPRWVIDAMIRFGPRGDRFLPWSNGFNLRKLAAAPHGVSLGEVATGILGRKVRTPDRRIHLRRPEIERELARLASEAERQESPDYPLQLIGRRDPRSNNSWLHNVPKLMQGDRCRRLRVHPADAARLGLADGGRAVVRSRVGFLEAEVRVTDEVMPGVVSLPHGWGHHSPANRVATRDPGPDYNALVDEREIEPLAGMSRLNGMPVRVEPIATPAAAAG